MSDEKISDTGRLLPRGAVTLCLLLLTACAVAPQRTVVQPSRESATTQDRQQLVEIARAQIGVPYRFGGTQPGRGFDCSGLVYYSYRQAGVAVPRTVAQQMRFAAPVSAAELRPGDLVFFDTSYKGGHVGIYTGEGRFVHAPSSGGRVREEHLEQPYWHRRWIGGGDLL